jgi:pimeloyl-ACP methyl ester carboxylesterase
MHAVRRGSGRPVVFIHGGFGSSYDFTLSFFDRASSRYDCLAVDRPGHGYSQRPRKKDMTVFDHAHYIFETVKALKIERPVLVGHSLGGAVALAYALEHPDDVAGLMMINGYLTPFTGPIHPIHTASAVPLFGPLYLHALVRPLGNLFTGSIGRKVFYPENPPADYLKTATALAMRPAHFSANAADVRHLCKGLRQMIPRYSEIRCPVVLLAGDSDLIAPMSRHAEAFARAVPHAEILILKEGAHQPCFSMAEDVLAALDRTWEKAAAEGTKKL